MNKLIILYAGKKFLQSELCRRDACTVEIITVSGVARSLFVFLESIITRLRQVGYDQVSNYLS